MNSGCRSRPALSNSAGCVRCQRRKPVQPAVRCGRRCRKRRSGVGPQASDARPSDVSCVSGTNWTSEPGSEVRRLKSDRNFCQLMFMRVADDLADAGQSGDFFRRALRVAAGDHDLGFGVLAMNAADGGAGVLIGGGGHGAGVKNNKSRFAQVRPARSRPRSRNWRSMAAPSAWVARQPKFST